MAFPTLSRALEGWTVSTTTGGAAPPQASPRGSPRSSQTAASVLDASARLPSSKAKLDELFFAWLSTDASQKLVLSLLEDAKAGRLLSAPAPHKPAQSPTAAAAAAAAAAGQFMPPLSPQKGVHRVGFEGAGSPPLSPRRSVAAHASPHASLLSPASHAAVPTFYFGAGRPLSAEHAAEVGRRLSALFGGGGGSLGRAAFAAVTREVVELPSMFSGPLFDRLDPGRTGAVGQAAFEAFWAAQLAGQDTAGRAFAVLRREGRDCLTHADVRPLLLELLRAHPGLDFLREAPEFQERYVETVVYRLFFGVARADPARITARELRRSDALEAMFAVDETDDINRVQRYFSYEHFYVIYCRFWELDSDHDFLLDREDLLRYGGHALTYQAVDRLFAGAGRPFTSGVAGRMGYEDFVWFILCEEDKAAPAALAYWHRVLDLDGDGAVRPAEAAHFYEEQLQRMECLAAEPVAFEDMLCQLSDMLRPARPGAVTLADLRACPLAAHYVNAMLNLGKFLAYEGRDPFTIRAERDDPRLTDWDRFARAEYVRLSQEEEA